MTTITTTPIEQMLSELNPNQRQAAETIYGPVLVLAGAGSGKTRTMTVRIANMIANHGVQPSEMFVATFTNKAAREMKERITKVIGEEKAAQIWMGTFHSLCVRILRKYAHLLGYERNFVIYDTSDQLKLLERIYKMMGIEEDYKEGLALHYIDQAKNLLHTPDWCLYNLADSPTYEVMAQVYAKYQEFMKEANAMDFGDLIMNTVQILNDFPGAREYWQNRFKFVFADEYQDVNHAQFMLLSYLAWPQNNLFVVGDDYQSIYGFRGSDISNILSFERKFFPCTTIYLDQNYRSTEVIVHAGNMIMKHNPNQKEKNLFTDKKGGHAIQVIELSDERKESAYVASKIKKMVMEEGYAWSDFAVLYRNNAQSLALEQLFVPNFIPYKVVGGSAFFEREEIKDTVSYLRVIHNPKDDAAMLRILNKPARGIGKSSEEHIIKYANDYKVSIHRALRSIDDIKQIKKATNGKVKVFLSLLEDLRAHQTRDLEKFVKYVLDKTGYVAMWQNTKNKEAQDKLDNLEEFLRLVHQYQEDHPDKTLGDFLQEISLLTDVEEKGQNAVRLMTMHSSKGLEFPVVFIIGMNEGVFPSWRSKEAHELEEERRLAYVGITRAEKRLFLTYTTMRQGPRGLISVKPSRFLDELPEEILQKVKLS